ncbi:Wzz/FepE/Etk N-terminal domain-containing protein [Puniceibacterium sp. IMCC21224]|uniref:GumC family protein n=1 Tax=Puniceibacterium sp. IMCC21224 TaxID=1618204 RepID=UPI00064DA73D|nr:Wzz/FepE/Etk N-terminal domain-containing protein [Puniceibacterium sp. IMCC21224]KMK63815.1 uncharacterized protein involved in exopolysaccharide biosynthesis [Puniceibacterium sp. IMCC21224]
MDLKFYFSLFLRRLHWFLLFLIIGSAIGLTLAKVLPPVYVAKARLLVESEQIPDELAASTVRTEATEQLEIIQQRILTRDTLLDMANRLQIYAPGSGKAQIALDADTLVEDMRKRISMVTTGGGQRGAASATLVAVSFEASNARMSATVTNELVTLILREDVAMRTRTARQTLEFFEQEVARLDKELAQRGATILAFKEKNQEALPDSLDFRRSQQAASQERLLQLEREEAGLKDRRSRVVSLQDSDGALQDATPLRDQSPEQRQLQSLRDELSGLRAVLSPENPKIKLLEARLVALEDVVKEQLARAAGSRGGETLDIYEVQLVDIDGQLDFIASQKAQVQASLDGLAQSIEATPGNAITLDTFERDYANVRAQYDQAVANKARAETGDVIEALSKGQRISIIEQAVIPQEPERPNRVLIAAGGVSGGLLLGLAMVLLLELVNTGIRRPADLTAQLGIQPFATLPYYRTRRETLRRRSLIVGVLGTFLVGIPVGLWAVHTWYMPLDLLLDAIGQRFGLAGMVWPVPTAWA